MKRIASLLLCLPLIFTMIGCSSKSETPQIMTTTLPIFTFTNALCNGTGISVGQLITEDISCLHDYSLKVPQMRAIEGAEVLVISGAGLESFLHDTGTGSATVIDASRGIKLICHDIHHTNSDDHHHHGEDPHLWLSPEVASQMAKNICADLCSTYPQHTQQIESNLRALCTQLNDIQNYADEQLRDLSCREIVTFHDGFAYMAQAFDLTILRAIQEEAGSEASAKDLIELINMTQEHRLPAVFTEVNGNSPAASVIASQSNAKVYRLNMAMSGDGYFDAMYQNINTLKEALG